MTEIEIYKREKEIVRYRGVGHTEYGEYGEDILCAAVSTAMQFPLVGLQDILEITPKFEINSDGYLEVDIKGMDLSTENREKIQLLFNTMLLMIKELEKQYPKNIKLVEKEEI